MIPAANACLPWPRPFAYITEGGAGRLVREIHRLIDRDVVVRMWYNSAAPGQLSIKSDIKVRISSKGRVRIRRLYWSLQKSAQPGQPFQARTLIVEPDESPCWLDFPDDPDLVTAPRLLASADIHQILQYIPLRRLTVLAHDMDGCRSVLKLKRKGRVSDAAQRLLEIAKQAARQTQLPTLPTVLARSTSAGAQRLSYCTGVSLADLFNQTQRTELFRECGQHLASFHNLSAEKLPEDPLADISHLESQINHLCVFWPDASERLQQCLTKLADKAPCDLAMQLCHGDLSAEHILFDGSTCSLIDLDLAHRGDPSRDVSQLLTRLPGTLFQSADRLEQCHKSLLAGYERVRPGALSKQALLWQRSRAELESLSTAFRKDKVEKGWCHAALERAEQYCADFSR